MGLDMQALFAMANKTAAAGGKGAGISKKIAGLEGAYNKAEGVYNKAKGWDADGDGLEFADIARGGLAAAGSAGGMILGNMLLPGVGGMIGSTVLGGIGGGIGKLIGGDTKAEKAAKEEAEKAENDARRKAKAEKQARDAQAMQPQGVMSSVEVPQIDVINTEYRDDPNEYSGGGEQLSDEQYKEILGSALAVCDRRLKWVDHKHTLRYIRGMDALSDEDCKDIMSMVDPKQLAYELLEEGPPYSASDLRFLHDLMLVYVGQRTVMFPPFLKLVPCVFLYVQSIKLFGLVLVHSLHLVYIIYAIVSSDSPRNLRTAFSRIKHRMFRPSPLHTVINTFCKPSEVLCPFLLWGPA